jgi:hypothetical protein
MIIIFLSRDKAELFLIIQPSKRMAILRHRKNERGNTEVTDHVTSKSITCCEIYSGSYMIDCGGNRNNKWSVSQRDELNWLQGHKGVHEYKMVVATEID